MLCGRVGQQANGVRQHVDHGLELLDAPLRRTGCVADDAAAHHAGHATGEAAEWAHQPHRLGDTGRLALDDPTGALWGLVARREARATGGDHQTGEVVGERHERSSDTVGAIGHHLPINDLESVALEYALYQRALRRLLPGAVFSELRITGGGERSAVWNQLKADVLQTPIVQIENGGGTPMGAAMVAGVGAGILSDFPAAAAQWIQPGDRFEPDTSCAGYYQARTARYECLLRGLNDWANIDLPK